MGARPSARALGFGVPTARGADGTVSAGGGGSGSAPPAGWHTAPSPRGLGALGSETLPTSRECRRGCRAVLMASHPAHFKCGDEMSPPAPSCVSLGGPPRGRGAGPAGGSGLCCDPPVGPGTRCHRRCCAFPESDYSLRSGVGAEAECVPGGGAPPLQCRGKQNTGVHTPAHTHAHLHSCTRPTCTHLNAHTCLHVHSCTHMHTSTHTYIHTCLHTHNCTRTHLHTAAQCAPRPTGVHTG